MPKRIIIVGAGPIGCYTAQILKKYGYEPLIIEEHSEVGRPVHCTGLVGRCVFDDKRLFNISASSIINTINGAVIHYDKQSFSVERKNVAYVIDREKFDKALSSDLNILFQNKFLGFEKNKAGYIVETDKDELSADILIGADGANSMLRKALNPNGNNVKQYRGLQFRIKTKPEYKDMVEVYLKAPSFYWIVPEGENVVRVGTISEAPYKELENFIKEIKIKGDILERFGGLVSIGLCGLTAGDNIALVGDAACQVKPLTYGGIYFGLSSAGILADCIRNNRLNDYDRLWKKKLSSEIIIGVKAKNVYNRLSAEELKKIFRLLKEQKSFIERLGNFENHSRLILEIIKKPAFYPYLRDLFQMLLNKILLP